VNAEEAQAITHGQPYAWLHAHPHVQYLAVTQGAQQARLSHRCRGGGGAEDGQGQARVVTYVFELPELSAEDLVNPIGAGDACSGVTLSAALLQRRREERRMGKTGEEEGKDDSWVVPAFRLGLAAATASCGEEETSSFQLERVQALERLISIEVHVTR